MGKQRVADIASSVVASVIAGVIGNAVAGGTQRTRITYQDAKLPPFAPPGWAFPVAWTLNNASLTSVALEAARTPNGAAGKRELLALLAAHGALFFAWPFTFVRMRSPVLAAAVTIADLGVNAAAAYRASQLNKRYVLRFATTLAWLSLGSALAASIALTNRDPLFSFRQGDIKSERERLDAAMHRQEELAERMTMEHYHGEDKTVADTFPASDPPQVP